MSSFIAGKTQTQGKPESRAAVASWLITAGATALLLGCAHRTAVQPPPSYTQILAEEANGHFAQVTGPAPLAFPMDHGAHTDYQVEWWYLTGYLEDGVGHEYGYQFTLYRYGLQRNESLGSGLFDRSALYMGHFAVSDVSHQRYLSAENFARSPTNATVKVSDETIALNLDDWHLTIMEDNSMELNVRARAKQTDFALDLTLQAVGPLLLHGDEGYSRKGPEPGQASMYYSVIGLETAGRLQVGERNLQVRGTSWFDHEWSTSSLAADAVGWDWFSLQLENGAALMLGGIRTSADSLTQDATWLSHAYSYVSPVWVTPSGQAVPLEEGSFRIAVADYWTSDATGVQYPSGWHLNLPDLAVACNIDPLLKEQEFIGIGVYWEGLVEAVCEIDGVSTTGRGYVELTGYS